MNKTWWRQQVLYVTQISAERSPLMDGLCPGPAFGWFLRQKRSTDEPYCERYTTNTAQINKRTFYSGSVHPRCWYTGRVSVRQLWRMYESVCERVPHLPQLFWRRPCSCRRSAPRSGNPTPRLNTPGRFCVCRWASLCLRMWQCWPQAWQLS